jgi:hypothetical protein
MSDKKTKTTKSVKAEEPVTTVNKVETASKKDKKVVEKPVEKPVEKSVEKPVDKKADKKVAKKDDKKKAVKKDKKPVDKKDKKDKKKKEAKKAKKDQAKKDKKALPDGEKRKRYFKVIYTDPEGKVVMGRRVCGAKPKQAACKALTGIYKIFKGKKDITREEIKFGVCETTRGSNHKRYWYSGHKKQLDKPIVLYQMPSDDPKKKKYCSAEKIISDFGGFKKVFGMEQKDVPPGITYGFTNRVNKVPKEDCAHLMNVQKVTEEPEVVEEKKPKKTTKKPTTETTSDEPKEVTKDKKSKKVVKSDEEPKEAVKETTKGKKTKETVAKKK